ncbi:MAG: hypothetical protein ACXU8Z_01275, partial [Caulobacteraceae bacterium]
MFQVDGSTAVGSMPTPDAAGAAGWFTDGDPTTGSPATIVPADWLNGVQGELINVIAGAGLTPDKTSVTQLLTAIQTIAAAVASPPAPTGSVIYRAAASAPATWLIANGLTIGDAASGGTARANVDCLALFTLLWTDFTDAVLPIQTSGGAGSTRGASAGADWAAHKRITLPDLRGEFIRGIDLGRGIDAARVLGSEQLDDFKSHTHAIQVNNGTTGAGPKAQTASTSPGTAVNTDAA